MKDILYGIWNKRARKHWIQWRNRIRRDNRYFKLPVIQGEPDIILVIGAESTATRFFTEMLSQHSAIASGYMPGDHKDDFDGIWDAISKGGKSIEDLLPERRPGLKYLTRRSIPHARNPESQAKYREFPPVEKFLKGVISAGFMPVVFVTVRSPVPHLMSWKNNRASGEGSLSLCIRQYQDVYPYIFDAIARTGSPFYIIPDEALISDGRDLMESMFYLLGLDPPDNLPIIKKDLNVRYYDMFRRERYR